MDYLIEYLLKENKNIKINETPRDEEAKKRLYRSLCNIRESRPIKEEYIRIENEYLQEELQTGKAFLTKEYNLPAKFVIHTVGQIIHTLVTEREENAVLIEEDIDKVINYLD